MMNFASEALDVLSGHWYLVLVLLVCLVALISWALYQLSNSLRLALVVATAMFMLASWALYVQVRPLSTVALVLAIVVALFLVANELMESKGYNKEKGEDA